MVDERMETRLTAFLAKAGTVMTAVGRGPPGKERLGPAERNSRVGVARGRCRKFGALLSTFQVAPFRPPPMIRNHHAQTILGVLFPRVQPVGYQRKILETPCGDQLRLDVLEPTVPVEDEAMTVVFAHGLESNSRTVQSFRIVRAFADRGFRVYAMNHRGCGLDKPEDHAHFLKEYHLGFTDDLELVVKHVKSQHPNTRILLSGFSLGGNMVCKFLGEIGERASELGIIGAAVTSVPFDLPNNQAKVNRPFTKHVYMARFLKSLKTRALAKRRHFESKGVVDFDKIEQARTVGEFDEAYIAKVYGFDCRHDYYKRADSKPYLKRIRVPTFVLQAVDDPFIEITSIPADEDLEEAPVLIHVTSGGGHCGFVDRFSGPGYMATELARWLSHVRDGLQESGDKQA
ncbi:Protein ABHD1 [Porphyridium purpureum]|uniref:Protein ABHD1 n=1 Tax=Porphyridium purpureum TaxID=35688 RepID=A0A5J4YVE9_PORPP|nr:Protein ABHD1 [Porphyridium purpureum]|eukprot:POR3561..scf209_3